MEKIDYLTSWFYHMGLLHRLTHPISWEFFSACVFYNEVINPMVMQGGFEQCE